MFFHLFKIKYIKLYTIINFESSHLIFLIFEHLIIKILYFFKDINIPYKIGYIFIEKNIRLSLFLIKLLDFKCEPIRIRGVQN